MTVKSSRRREIICGIYKIFNSDNTRVYIGSSIDILKRWNSHIYSLKKGKHHSKKLQNYINKYGIDSISFTLLEECGADCLMEREQHYIDIYNPYFNSSKTAVVTLGSWKSEVTRRKISDALTGVKRSNKQKQLLKNYFSIPVLQYDRNGKFIREYPSGKEAAKKYNTSYSHIGECCNYNRRTVAGYVWRHKITNNIPKTIEFIESTYPITLKESRKQTSKKNMKSVLQYSLEGHFIKEFSSIKEASKITGANKLSISRCCRNKGYKTSGGYKWKFKYKNND